jgi:hypothetical protein
MLDLFLIRTWDNQYPAATAATAIAIAATAVYLYHNWLSPFAAP